MDQRRKMTAFLVLVAALTGCSSGAPVVSARQAEHPGQGHATTPPASVRDPLTSGLYTDAPDGTPHYVLSFTSSAGNVLRGSASFLYQDGRVAAVGSYVGRLSGRKITLTLADGKFLSGSYTADRLNLAGCATALPLATTTGDCTFTYHGHVP
jgi:hypothetical protein